MYLAAQNICMLVVGKEASTLSTLHGIANCINPIQHGLFGAPQAWGGEEFLPLSNSGLDYDIKTKLCTNIPHISTINLECSEF